MKTPIALLSKTSGPNNKPPSMRYIVRVDVANCCWKVVLSRAGKHWFKYFADAQHGGKRRALAAAKAWRDALLLQISGSDYEVWKRERPQARNTSGVPGVWRGVLHRKNKAGDVVATSRFWQAFWVTLDGRRRLRTFGIAKYGEERAKALAILARREGIAEVAREAARRVAAAGPSERT